MSRPVAGAIVLACLALCGVAQGAPVQWPIGDGGNGHLYEAVLVEGGITWYEADAAAEAAGVYLVTVTSPEENDFVYGLVSDNDAFWFLMPGWGHGNGPWLGGFQPEGSPEPAGGWRWVTEEPFNYTNWDPQGEPNNAHPNENYIHFFGRNTLKAPFWNDARGSNTPNGYIVEIPEPASLALLAVGGLLLIRRRGA